MVKYILNMIENIPEDMKGVSATPEGHHIFVTNEDLIKLSQSDTEFFRRIVAQLMYLSNQVQPDI